MNLQTYQSTKKKSKLKKLLTGVLLMVLVIPLSVVMVAFSNVSSATNGEQGTNSSVSANLSTLDFSSKEKPILLAQVTVDCLLAANRSHADCVSNINAKAVADKYGMSEDSVKAIVNIIQGLNYVMTTFYMLLMPLIVITGKLLSNDWVMGGYLNIDIMIEMVWQIIRNMVNIFIVFYLLYMAGANIAGFGSMGSIKQNVDIKQKLPWVAAALILVNFSMFFCKQVINIANLTTTVAFSFPTTVSGNLINTQLDTITGGYNPFVWSQPIPKDMLGQIAGYTNATGATPTTTTATAGSYVVECLHRNYGLNLRGEDNKLPLIVPNPGFNEAGQMSVNGSWYYRMFFTSPAGQKASAMAQKTADITTIARTWNNVFATPTATGVAGTAGNVYYPYYGDCITTWDELAFSSRNAMFAYAFNIMRIQDFQAVLSTQKTFEDIVTKNMLAIVMLGFFLLVNIAMVIAMIIRSMYIWIMLAISPLWVVITVLKLKSGSLSKMMEQFGPMTFVQLAFMPTAVGFVLSIGFMMLNYIKYVGSIDGGDVGRIPLGSINFIYDASMPLLGGLANVIDMMIALMGIGVLWVGVFWALKIGLGKTDAFKNWIAPIEGFGKSIGNAALSAPAKLPIIPIPGRGVFSLDTMKGALQNKTQAFENFGRPDPAAVNRLLGEEGKDDKFNDKESKNLKEKLKNATTSTGAISDILRTKINTGSNLPEAALMDLIKQLDGKAHFAANSTQNLNLKNIGDVSLKAEALNPLIDAINALKSDPTKAAEYKTLKNLANGERTSDTWSDDETRTVNKFLKDRLSIDDELLGKSGTKSTGPVEVTLSDVDKAILKKDSIKSADFKKYFENIEKALKTKEYKDAATDAEKKLVLQNLLSTNPTKFDFGNEGQKDKNAALIAKIAQEFHQGNKFTEANFKKEILK